MAKLKQLPESLADFRNKLGINQTVFWQRYGVTQSAGSRYESGRSIPKPLRLLVRLHLNGVITDADLTAAMKK
jgi:predicted transcriptional regulator